MRSLLALLDHVTSDYFWQYDPYPLTLPSKDKLGGYLVPYNMMMGGRTEDQL
jgi:hypothetical protein